MSSPTVPASAHVRRHQCRMQTTNDMSVWMFLVMVLPQCSTYFYSDILACLTGHAEKFFLVIPP